jgi:hypothetical protein
MCVEPNLRNVIDGLNDVGPFTVAAEIFLLTTILSRWALGPTSLLSNWYLGLPPPGLERPEHESDHSAVKNAWGCMPSLLHASLRCGAYTRGHAREYVGSKATVGLGTLLRSFVWPHPILFHSTPPAGSLRWTPKHLIQRLVIRTSPTYLTCFLEFRFRIQAQVHPAAFVNEAFSDFPQSTQRHKYTVSTKLAPRNTRWGGKYSKYTLLEG